MCGCGVQKYRLSKYYTTFINKGRVTCWARRLHTLRVPGGRGIVVVQFSVTWQIFTLAASGKLYNHATGVEFFFKI